VPTGALTRAGREALAWLLAEQGRSCGVPSSRVRALFRIDVLDALHRHGHMDIRGPTVRHGRVTLFYVTPQGRAALRGTR